MRAFNASLILGACLLACGEEVVELLPARPGDEVEVEVAGSVDASRAPGASVDAGSPSVGVQVRGDSEAIHSEGELVEFPFVDSSAELEPVGCQKVDFLFVVDNSRSMRDKQEALVRSFDGFMATVQETLRVEDFHVMAVDTDGERLPDLSLPLSDEDCDDALGAGRRDDAAGASCGIQGDRRFMTRSQADLPGTFACVATAGASGSFVERPVEAALNAVSEAFTGTGGCNEGFLRPEAILVVIWITDEDDQRSSDDPSEWRAQLLDAKQGQEDAVVLLALVGPEPLFGLSLLTPCGRADVEVASSSRLRELVGSFDAGFVGDVCDDDYTPFFADAVSSVVRSCDAFVPPVQ